MKKEYVKPCPNCKLFSMYLADAHFFWYGNKFKKYVCDECGHEEIV
ncbi:hypothetical protein IGJ83_001918 [Enterococcus pernyi]|uniref:Uncharacterized protein n=1 Tax=Enterococcus mundtii TaxID=53346 RepID=A0ABQ0VE24_ENTMU|nr:hypothetical protein [Enterococcus mundtii]EME3537699.1 hypothetical protein [Enterococcus faecium]GEN18801.1 hypothetical protein LAC02_20820 [Ligilactobacillus acidipiscis]MZZ58350.1 hypothetical protein [Enterococcus mundtii]MZZ61326.1 hypothetical protein [Enterococcus mundtii]MZZ68310.1 hypothetical protein [Enterococcus mundtii]